VAGNPSCRQITKASLSSQLLSHTALHVPPMQYSTVPAAACGITPPRNCTLPLEPVFVNYMHIPMCVCTLACVLMKALYKFNLQEVQ
jgi:uncharacterized protein involved in cysteine biosynthesis